MIKLVLLILAVVANCSAYYSYGATDGSYFAWRARIAKVKKEKPHMCSFLDLTRPTLQWDFPSNITCTNDVSKLGLLGKVPVGLRCAYTYSCSMDYPGYHRRTTMECQSNGKWEGSMPDCSFEDKMIDDIVDLYNNKRLPTFFPRQEEREGEEEGQNRREEEEIEDEERENKREDEERENKREDEQRENKREDEEREQERGAKKAIFIKSLKPDNLVKICQNEKFCVNLHRVKDCLKHLPAESFFTVANRKFLTDLRMMMLGLCVRCYNRYCKETIKLI